jgi:hypothetical protein
MYFMRESHSPHPLLSFQIPLNHPMDIEPLVRFAARGNVLEVPDLREIGKTLSVLSNLRRMLEASPVSRPSQQGMEDSGSREILPDLGASI